MRMDDNSSKVVAEGKVITVDLVKGDHSLAIADTNKSLLNTKNKLRDEMIATGELKRLSDTISLNDKQSIIVFGQKASEDMSKCSDEILRKQDIDSISKTGAMMNSLTKIMNKVDIKELDKLNQEPTVFEKIFGNPKNKIAKLLGKYTTVSDEIENVCVELRTQEQEIQQTNRDLQKLYDAGVASYKELAKYILAGEHALGEMDEYIENLEASSDGSPEANIWITNAKQTQDLLATRVQDLRLADAVALQSLPVIKAMEYGNLNLARKINSSFIVTIPVFKNAVAQAVIAKRQSIQAQELKHLDEVTNELLLRNAQNAADNMKLTAELAGNTSIKMDTIRQTWQTILDGINDTKAIQEELARQRETDRIELEYLEKQFIEGISTR